MSDNAANDPTVDIIPIGNLKETYLVPSYQRGYRWTEFEIKALLDDIQEFDSRNGKLRYCIQPLIVKLRSDGKYEIVDGQQRLTTLFIFIKLAQTELHQITPTFGIEYETRKGSSDFLNDLSSDTCNDESNIDYYFMGEAYKAMDKWLCNKKAESGVNKNAIIVNLYSKIMESVFFIRYELPHDTDPVDIFSKVNIGKIPLTDAELIKALLLNSKNFSPDESHRRRTELSYLWDKTEQALHRDSLWYFLNDLNELNERKKSGTRIDMIFDLLAKEYNSLFELNISKNEPHFSFVVLNSVLNGKNSFGIKKSAAKIWQDTEQIFEELHSWYEDYNKYHLIGYLLAQNRSIPKIRAMMNKKSRKESLRILLREIKKDCPWTFGSPFNEKQKELFYGNNNQEIRRVLLMFNIALLVCSSDRQMRFPFDIYKTKKWDIEHIHATADESAESDDSLGNLTLLNARINRGYSNSPFEAKRRDIIRYEKNGDFIPLGTKGVFYKHFTENIGKNDIWEENDKQDYVREIRRTLEEFLKGSWIDRKSEE